MLETQRDPRVQRSQQMIQEALMELAQTMPFQKISVSAIATAAGVNRSTFYEHYTDKYDLLEHVVRGQFEDHLAQHVPAPADFQQDDIPQLIKATTQFLERFTKGCTPTDKQLDPLMDKQIQNALQDYLLAWAQSGQAAIADDAEIQRMVAGMMSATIFAMGKRWLSHRHNGCAKSLDFFADHATIMLTQGVFSPLEMSEQPSVSA